MKMFDTLGIQKEDYFLTGSRALDNKELGYIISSDDSDYDFVVSILRRHWIIGYLQRINIEIEYSCYNGGFKFLLDGKKYNIISCIGIEFMAWRESLSMLQHLIKTSSAYRTAIANKKIRYCLYEQLRGLCKTAITINEFI